VGVEQFFELFAFLGIRKGDATQHNRVTVVVNGYDLVIAGGLGADQSNQLVTQVEMREVRGAQPRQGEEEIEQFNGLDASHREQHVDDLASALFLYGERLVEFFLGDASGGAQELANAPFRGVPEQCRPMRIGNGLVLALIIWRSIRGIHWPLNLGREPALCRHPPPVCALDCEREAFSSSPARLILAIAHRWNKPIEERSPGNWIEKPWRPCEQMIILVLVGACSS